MRLYELAGGPAMSDYEKRPITVELHNLDNCSTQLLYFVQRYEESFFHRVIFVK
jgi:hypothetical protein